MVSCLDERLILYGKLVGKKQSIYNYPVILRILGSFAPHLVGKSLATIVAPPISYKWMAIRPREGPLRNSPEGR